MVGRCLRAVLGLAVFTAGCAVESPPTENVGIARQRETVDQAAASSCSTTSVSGLSTQIVAQSNCLAPGAFVAVPPQPNVTFSSSVFAYLEQPAMDAFVTAVTSSPGTQMTVNSMLRTVAQQYLLYTWYLSGQCGIGLAASPGNSNHETGLALDIDEYSTWLGTLEAHGFSWFGSSDPVHYDYTGPGAVDQRGTDVLAFQMLWNFANPGDVILEDGIYGPQTEQRLRISPAEGFPVVPPCGTSVGADVWPAIAIDAPDVFSDHTSQGIADLFEGDVRTVAMDVTNKGSQAAESVDVGVWIEEPYLVATHYEIQSDWEHPGEFATNDANDDPDNPAHDDPGEGFTLHLHQLSPGETKRVVLTLNARQYSIGLADAPDVRFWVKDIPNVYHQEDFGSSPSVSAGQTFPGGVLQVFVQSDVYSHTRWEWNTDRFEGWSASGDASIAGDGMSTLLVGSAGADPGIVSPTTSFSADDYKSMTVRLKRSGGSGAAKLYFATTADPALDEDKLISFQVEDDDKFHELEVDLGKSGRWGGTVTQLRFDPFESGMGSVELDYLRFNGTGQGGGGAGGKPSGPGAGSGWLGDGVEPAGCSCQAAGPDRPLDSVLGLLIAGLVMCARRGRRIFC